MLITLQKSSVQALLFNKPKERQTEVKIRVIFHIINKCLYCSKDKITYLMLHLNIIMLHLNIIMLISTFKFKNS